MEDHVADKQCTECTRFNTQAYYCIKCKYRTFCSNSCVNVNIHKCFTTNEIRAERIKLDAVSRVLYESTIFRDMYIKSNKPARVKRRGCKNLFIFKLTDIKVCDIAANPMQFCRESPATALNEICSSSSVLITNWNNVMGVVLRSMDEMLLIHVIWFTEI